MSEIIEFFDKFLEQIIRKRHDIIVSLRQQPIVLIIISINVGKVSFKNQA